MNLQLINQIIGEAAAGHALDPIILAAPTQRCGSTLIQRAINQGRDAVIFGENFLFMEKHPFLIGGPFQDLDVKISETQAFMEVFRDSTRHQDATHLYPDYRGYLKTLLQGFYGIAEHYRAEAEALGVTQWGIKNQILNVNGFSNALFFLPGRRLIVLYRNPLAVARSFRARWPDQLATPEQVRDLGRRWRTNMEFLMSCKKRCFQLRYEDMEADRESIVGNLEDFLGCRISRQAFDTRVNAHLRKRQFDDLGGKGTGVYIKPAALTPEEERILIEGAGEMYVRLGYG